MAVQEKRRPIRKDEIRDWMSVIHVLFIDGLSMSAELSLARIAFHGGTNLHLSWNSPRFLGRLGLPDFEGFREKNWCSHVKNRDADAASHRQS